MDDDKNPTYPEEADVAEMLKVGAKAITALLTGRASVRVREIASIGGKTETQISFEMPPLVSDGATARINIKNGGEDPAFVHWFCTTYPWSPNPVSLSPTLEQAKAGKIADGVVRPVRIVFLDGYDPKAWKDENPLEAPPSPAPITYDAPSQEPEAYGRNPDGSSITGADPPDR